MNIFFVKSIGDINFLENNEFEENIKKLGIKKDVIDIFGLKGIYINEKNFEDIKDILPLMNGMFGKYYFIDSCIGDDNIILGKNIFDVEYDEKKLKDITENIENIKKDINSDKLITRTKKEEYFETIKESIYLIISFLIKTYFILTDTIENKEELEKIINSSSIEEFKANAYLINEVGFQKIELLTTRFEIISKQLSYFSLIMNQYFKNYIK
ncbi:hypothetical protein [Candidatus Vampirococcus lugosii]|uniref:Uncharacterized protein n=1 Tax=Candidatus Vampirococcus lugosii TaxID=2789015 RepID=A0ABS5QK65_9BACT|nr:hypothetical protein [Candidatus Vampirococcus lugosii]MBS8121645.1 hypothetical protein [Candidatus Vampirococcus lugosii]